MIIGANKPNGRIVQNKSRLSAIRLRARDPRRAPAHRASCAAARCGCARGRKVVLSQKVDGLERGDVLAVIGGAALRRAPPRLQRAGRRRADRRPRPARDQAQPAGRAARSGRSGEISPAQRHQLHPGPIAVPDPQGRRGQGPPRRPRRLRRHRRRCSSTWSCARSRSGSSASTAPACASAAAALEVRRYSP